MRLFACDSAAKAWLKRLSLLCAVATCGGSIRAAGLIVTNTADSGAGSLRDTIASAVDGDTIGFDSALNGQTITITSSELVIDKNILIAGPGPGLLTVGRHSNRHRIAIRMLAADRLDMAAIERIPEGGGFRIFHIMPDRTVTIRGLTISDAFFGDVGGGIFNEHATLTVENCIVQYNQAYSGSGIYSSGVNASLTIVTALFRETLTISRMAPVFTMMAEH